MFEHRLLLKLDSEDIVTFKVYDHNLFFKNGFLGQASLRVQKVD
jgi:hypothetical protein